MWNPHEIRKLIAQIAGIALGIGGFYLIVTVVQATGRINITSSILSGELESGSAGLFLLFLSFLLIVLPSLFGTRSINIPSASTNEFGSKTALTPQARFAIVTVALIVLTFALLFGGEYVLRGLGFAIGGVFVAGGVIAAFVSVICLVVLVSSWIEPEQFQTSKPRSKEKEG